MPLSHIKDVKHWRDRAAEIRALATMMKDIETIAIMSRLAAGYDLMADRAEARAGRDGNVPSPLGHNCQHCTSSGSFAIVRGYPPRFVLGHEIGAVRRPGSSSSHTYATGSRSARARAAVSTA
jgi:hypothetical protein